MKEEKETSTRLRSTIRVRARPLGIDGGLTKDDMVGTSYMDPANDENADENEKRVSVVAKLGSSASR